MGLHNFVKISFVLLLDFEICAVIPAAALVGLPHSVVNRSSTKLTLALK